MGTMVGLIWLIIKFPLNALNGNKIFLNNFGNDLRDFTHVSDIVNGILKLIKSAKKIKKVKY